MPDRLRFALDHFDYGAEVERGADVHRDIAGPAHDTVHDGLGTFSQRSIGGIADDADDLMAHPFVLVRGLKRLADRIVVSEVPSRQSLVDDGRARAIVRILIS